MLVVSEQSNPLSGGIHLGEFNKNTDVVINEPFKNHSNTQLYEFHILNTILYKCKRTPVLSRTLVLKFFQHGVLFIRASITETFIHV